MGIGVPLNELIAGTPRSSLKVLQHVSSGRNSIRSCLLSPPFRNLPYGVMVVVLYTLHKDIYELRSIFWYAHGTWIFYKEFSRAYIRSPYRTPIPPRDGPTMRNTECSSAHLEVGVRATWLHISQTRGGIQKKLLWRQILLYRVDYGTL